MNKATIYLNEDELSYLLTFLPDEEKRLRPYFQAAGENIFKWNK